MSAGNAGELAVVAGVRDYTVQNGAGVPTRVLHRRWAANALEVDI